MMIAAGPRDAEAELIGWVREHRARDAADVWPPLRIVVPSRSLRRHLLAVLAAKLGALAGVRVQTHRSLAHEVLDRAGEAPPAGGSTAQELLVRRIAAGEPALRDALGGLEDGYAPVAAAVRDLIDAGFEDAMMDRAVDAVLRSGLTGDRLQRALAVLRVAAAVIDAGRKLACPHRGTLLERAATRLAAEPEVLPARGVLVVGFAEATGLVTRLLRALVERPDAEIIVEHPPDPARPETPDAGWIFTERLRTALDLPRPPDRLPMPEPPRLDLFRAPGPEAEVRETAARIRRLLDGGAAPESIAVIARRLDESLLAVVRRQLDRLGIPFSAESATMPGGAEARRARALARLLSDGPDTPVPVWLTALEPGPAIGDPAVLELALRAAGADTVGRVAGLDATLLCGDRGHFATPVVERIEERDGVEHRIRIQVPRAVLERAIGLAERLRHRIEARPERLGPAELLEWTSGVLAALGWPGDERDPVRAALAGLAAEIPPGLPVAWEELAPLCTRTLAGLGAVPAGGDGGGVQVLSVTEARGRTFEHVFLIALNRGLFPFRRPEDPMLPEAARRALADLLPEIPLAARSPLEERYLFAQLLAAAPAVTLGFATMDAEARELNPSAFLERLDLEGRLPRPLHGGAAEFPPADDVLTPGREDEVRPPLEHLAVEALAGRRSVLAAMLEEGAGPAGRHAGAMLEALDPSSCAEPLLGPLDGIVGLPPPAETWVTRLEAFSACPWRFLAERILGIVPPPETGFAEGGLGGILLGSLVHAVLEETVTASGAPSRIALEELPATPLGPSWPDPDRLAATTRTAARRVCAEAGVPYLASALARRALGLLEHARETDWEDGPPAVLAAEAVGATAVRLADRELVIRFRADRVDRRPDGALVLTDYKTGNVRSAKRRETLWRYVRRGTLLQGAAYALAPPGGGIGRYLRLKDGIASEERAVELDGRREADAAWSALRTAVAEIVAAWEAGVLLPRPEHPGGSSNGGLCDSCAARPACLRDDSSYRLRLRMAVEALPEDHPVRRLWMQPTAGMPGGSR